MKPESAGLFRTLPWVPRLIRTAGGVLAVALGGCDEARDPRDFRAYFGEGEHWLVYQVAIDNWRHVTETARLIERRVRTDAGLTIERHDGSLLEFTFLPHGLYLEADAPDAQASLIVPLPLAPGHTWEQQVETRFIPEFACGYCTRTKTLRHPVVLEKQIASLNETVETSLARFRGCLRIDGFGTAPIDAGKSMGTVDISVSTREWYAPGIGLVRLEWHERTNARILETGTYTMTLEAVM